ncbi:MAG TPA: flagellar filament capping protein FliD [Verrucomicrobiae bacterium]|jgi:flagellar hook-associated protein 2|nr:flagellar filament capping protein FliD [Verrucomicrobiae bacterium]
MSTASTISSILNTSQVPQIGLTNNTNTSLASTLAVSGLASGMDWQNIVLELAQAERAPETQWQSQQTALNTQNSAFTTIKGDLTTLQADLQGLQDPTLYQSTAAQSSNPSVATAATGTKTSTGNFTFNISQLATAAQINGAGHISQILAPGGDVSSVTIGTAGFTAPVTAGTFTVDGAQVTIAATDSLQDVFDKIASATSNKVTANYNSTTDEINLASSDSSEIVLGSAADTSNFLQVAQLYNNGTDSVTSASALGRVNTTVSLSGSDLATAVTDGGSGNGEFTINGVAISYDASSDSIQNVLDRINSSTAGVTATYDTLNNRFTLTNNSTGDVGISMQDVTGNFLVATGLSSGALTHGQNLLYTLNGGSQQLVSQSNKITQSSSGITGLSVIASGTGITTVTTSSDTSKISSAIQQFITDYNNVQTAISSQQIVSTASDGTGTPGPLTGDQTANNLANNLRSLSFFSGSGLSNSITSLADLGIQSNGQDNTLALSDSDTLNNALTNNLNAVQSFFSDATSGMATQLNNYITNVTGDDGELTNHQASLTQQNNNLGTQISNLETKIASDSAFWTSEFQAMEQAEEQANQELTYLSEQVTNGSL